MKKLLALVLAACMLGGTAFAEEPLRVLDGWFAGERYQARYPERALERLEIVYDENGIGNQNELLFSGEWDAAVIETNETNLSALCAAVPLLDLTNAAPEKGETLYPAVKRALTCGDVLAGLPIKIFACTTGTEFSEELLERLELADEGKPQTYSELAALAERYMALPSQTRRGTAFDADVRDGWLQYYLSLMIRSYQARCADADGETDFDTPLFRENLAQVERLSAALRGGKNLLRGSDGALRSLTWSSVGLEAQIGVREGDTAIPAQMFAVIVNAASPRVEEALDYVQAALEEAEIEFFYVDIDYDARLREEYDRMIAAQIEEGEDQAVIDRLEKMRDAGEPLYYYTKEYIADYARNIAPNLTFPYYRSINEWKAVCDYAAGLLDADGLIERLMEE